MTDEYINYLYDLAKRGSKPGLERIFNALHDVGDPQNRLSVIQVTGTNGKGSYCKMLGSILMNSNYRVGVFSSPHLEFINECIVINECQITDSELSATIKELQPIFEKHELTQFEALTVMCIVFFVQKGVDIAIFEVGMGGGLDATNVFEKNIMSVILGVSLDHTAFLGSNVTDIAREKSGIIKEGCPVFLASDNECVIDTVLSRANELHCPVLCCNHIVSIKSSDYFSTVFSYGNKTYKLSSGADYQVYNAEKVLASLEILGNEGYNVTEEAISKAFDEFYRPARFEVISTNPFILFDGAHNPEGVTALVRNIQAHSGNEKFDLAVGIMADKDIDFICRSLSDICHRVYTVTAPNPRAISSESLCKIFTDLGVDAVSCGDFDTLLHKWNGNSPLICTGSLYSYGEFKKSLLDSKYIN